MLPLTKRQQVINFLLKEDYKAALRIAKTFTVELNKDEQRTVQIAYECLGGRTSYYSQLGINTEVEIKKAKELLKKKYLETAK